MCVDAIIFPACDNFRIRWTWIVRWEEVAVGENDVGDGDLVGAERVHSSLPKLNVHLMKDKRS